jgi:Phosphotransferase enzyme family
MPDGHHRRNREDILLLMIPPQPRTVRLVVLDSGGEIAGITSEPIPVASPWWPEAGPVVDVARALLGADVAVLRLLDARSDRPAGGLVTYLVEAFEPIGDAARAALSEWGGALDDHPLRQSWARPGGPQADLAWADAAIHDAGREQAGRPEQVRSWNLSSLWRIPTTSGDVWLKHVPRFFGHEGAVLERLAGRGVPKLVARDGARILIDAIPGIDLYDAETPVLEALVRDLVEIQVDLATDAPGLLDLGLPDWRAAPLTNAISQTFERSRTALSVEDVETLDRFIDRLDERFARLASAGLPDTLVHGDFHPGNARGTLDDLASLTLLDWGDSGVGHPLLDQPAYLDRIPPEAVEPIRRVWAEAWETARPGCDPHRAATQIAPIAAARQAVIYRGFLDRIEPSEQIYHRGDPELWLGRAAALVRAERG